MHFAGPRVPAVNRNAFKRRQSTRIQTVVTVSRPKRVEVDPSLGEEEKSKIQLFLFVYNNSNFQFLILVPMTGKIGDAMMMTTTMKEKMRPIMAAVMTTVVAKVDAPKSSPDNNNIPGGESPLPQVAAKVVDELTDVDSGLPEETVAEIFTTQTLNQETVKVGRTVTMRTLAMLQKRPLVGL